MGLESIKQNRGRGVHGAGNKTWGFRPPIVQGKRKMECRSPEPTKGLLRSKRIATATHRKPPSHKAKDWIIGGKKKEGG